VSRPRRWWFSPVLALLVLAAVELVSFGVYRAVAGRSFSYAAVRAEQGRRRAPGAAALPPPGETGRPRQFLQDDVLHPYLGFTGNPSVDRGFSNLGFWGTLAMPLPRRGPDRLLVAVAGGSLAADFYEYGGERLKERLRQSATWRGRDIVLLNTAYGGYKQPQQLIALAWLLALGGELDVVVNLDGFNEVALDAVENAEQGVFPAYPRGWALRVERFADPGLVERVGAIAVLESRQAGLAGSFAAVPWRYSITAGLVWTLLDRRASGALAEARRALNAYRPADRRFQATGPPRPATDDAVYEDLADIWQRGSLQLERLCRANGIEYFHFLQPNQYVEGAKPMGPDERRVAVDPGHPYRRGVERGYPLLRRRGQALVAEGVAFEDLTEVFAGVGEPLYVDNCCHVNQRGYELLADAVARYLTLSPAILTAPR